MELTDFNEQHNHNYTEEDRYVVPKQPEVRESLEAFQDRKFGVMVLPGAPIPSGGSWNPGRCRMKTAAGRGTIWINALEAMNSASGISNW